MEFSSTIKVFLFITSCLALIADKSHGAPMKGNYINLRPGDMRRLSHILQRLGDFQIDSKAWNKRQYEYEMTTTTKPTVDDFTPGPRETFTNRNLNLVRIGQNKNNDEKVRGYVRQQLEDLFPSSNEAASVFYFD